LSDEIYVIVEVVKVHDPEGLAEYQKGARAQIGPRGGIVVGRGSETLFGDPPFGPLLIQKWPNREVFLEWQESEDYRPLKEIRERNAVMRLSIVNAV
jgi:uncharacterized protein (DUF1330 family)